MGTFFSELKRRNVFRVAIFYAIIAWLILQVSDVLIQLLQLPEWTGRFTFFVLLLGFPLALFFSWAYEITPEGLKREKDVDQSQSITNKTGRKLDATIIAVLAVAVIYFVVDKFFLAEQAEVAGPASESNEELQSIAVLPFVNMSSDTEQEYFADGMTEEILNTLVGIPGLQVAARTSAFRYKGERVDIRDVGKELGVSNILEGSIRRAGDDLKITAQLVRTKDGFHLWSQTYDRRMENVFEIQEDIAAQIAEALKTPLGVSEQRDIARTQIDLDVYDKYLRARALWRVRGDQLVEALELFREVVAAEPEFADAWAGLALTLQVLPYYGFDTLMPEDERRRQGFHAAKRAVELAPDAVASNHALGVVYRDDWNWKQAGEHLSKALEVDPDSTDVMEDYSEFLWRVGEVDEAWQVAQRTVELDPFVPIFVTRVANLLVVRDEQEAALDWARRLADLELSTPWFQFFLAENYLLMGNRESTRQVIVEMGEDAPLTGEDFDSLMEWADDRDLPTTEKTLGILGKFFFYPYQIDRYEDAFPLAENASRFYKGYWISSLMPPAATDAMRHPRAKAVIAEVGLPDYWREVGWPTFCRPLGGDDFECGVTE